MSRESKRSRELKPDDQALWSAVTRSIAPLKKRKAKIVSPPPVSQIAGINKKTASKYRLVPAPPVKVLARPAPRLAPLDRRTKKKLARGSKSIDARLDLHGMTQDEAHHALRRFLRRAQGADARFVLVITGKGSRGEGGVLKRQAPLWLGLPDFRDYVAGFESAHIGHGGEGALYVQMRRARKTITE